MVLDVIQHQAATRLRVVVVVAVPQRHAHIYETLLIYVVCTCFSLRALLEVFFHKNKKLFRELNEFQSPCPSSWLAGDAAAAGLLRTCGDNLMARAACEPHLTPSSIIANKRDSRV